MAQDMIRWLYDLQHFGIKLGLDNIRALLALLGHPERAYRSVHVAGTNGKGSVAAMVDAMLAAHDVASGLFTSPHLISPNERIRIAGTDITDAELHQRLAAMRKTIEAGIGEAGIEAHPSFFEVVTATALEAFRDHGLEAAVLEVGLGGRLDATNAVDTDVSVIVSIALDHTKTLGPTLAQIAREKGGIIKRGRPVVSGVVPQRAIDVLRRRAGELDAPWVEARVEARLVAEDADGFSLATRRARYPALRPALPGRHQIDNARVALTAFELLLERLGRPPDPDAVREALGSIRWPGRLHRIEAGDGRPAMLLDAAHNPEGMDTLIDHLEANPLPRPVLLFGATSGKPLQRLLEPLGAFAREAVVTCPPVRRGVDPAEVEAVALPYFDRVEVLEKTDVALARAQELARPDGAVLVTGSLYLVGEVLGLLEGRRRPGPVSM
jgi:dihydrofolate synthase/folylpolyglutamate synthase